MTRHIVAGVTSFYDYPINLQTAENQLVSHPHLRMLRPGMSAAARKKPVDKTVKQIAVAAAVFALFVWAQRRARAPSGFFF